MSGLTSILSTLLATLILSLAFLYLYLKEREKFLQYLFLAFAANLLRYITLSFYFVFPQANELNLLNNIFTLISSMLLLKAVYLIIERRIKFYWYVFAVCTLIWMLLSPYFTIDILYSTLPVYIFTGLVFGLLGLRFLWAVSIPKLSRISLGVIFIVWGLHKLNYPFLKDSPEIVPFGFALASFLSIASAIGFVFLYFEKTREKIVESETRLRMLFENHSSIFMLIDSADGSIQYVNKAASKFYGYTAEEMQKMNINQFNISSPEQIKENMNKVKRGEKNFFEFKHKLKSGEFRDVNVYASINKIDNKEVIYSIIIDQTEKKRIEENLLESEKNFRTLLENIPGTVYRCEVYYPWKALFVSSNMIELSGYTPDDFTSEQFITLGNLIHSDDLINVEKSVNFALAARKSYTIEYRMLHKNGSIKWVYEKGRAYYNQDNEPIYLDGVYIDITKKKMLEQSLIESESKFRLAFEAIPDAMFIVRVSDDIIKSMNSGFEQLTNYSLHDLSGKELNKQDIFDINYYNSFRELLSRDGIINHYEITLITKNAVTKTCLLSAVYISIEEELHYIAMAHDISDLKSYQKEIQEVNTKLEEKIEQRTAQLNDTLDKLQKEIDSRIRVQEELEDSNYELKELNESMIIHSQKLLDLNERLSDSEAELLELNRELESRVNERTEELIEAYNKLENANQLKGIILNNLGHELRTPLNGAMGFLSMLLSEVSHNEHKEMLGLSYNSMKRLERTLNSLLYLTELESSKIKLNIEKVAVPTMLKYYFKTLFEMYEKNELEFEIEIKDNKINALVDERLLYQVFYNVFDNAVKFTQNGTIRIVCTSEINNNKKMALVKVIDSGIGIKKENISKIFEPFRQESEGLSRISEGLGLGLSISQKMLNIMNGEIEIQSEYHSGTCVCIYLPAAED